MRLTLDIRSYSIAIGIAAILAVIPKELLACSCGRVSIGDRFALSENVFTAVIVSEYEDPNDDATPLRYTFEVKETFKGEKSPDVLVSHPFDGTCGIKLEISQEYLIFTPDSGRIGLCSGIRKTADAQSELVVLRNFISTAEAKLSNLWTFQDVDDACALNTIFDIGTDFASGTMSISAAMRSSAQLYGVDPVEAVWLFIDMGNVVKRSEGGDTQPIELLVSDISVAVPWVGGSFREFTAPGREVIRAVMPNGYAIDGSAARRVLENMMKTESFIIRYDADQDEIGSPAEVSAASLGSLGLEMSQCLQR